MKASLLLISKICFVSAMATSLLKIKKIARHGITHPFGDHRSVLQAFPAGVDTKESDPFLMCDYFNIVEDEGPVNNPDHFPVSWHPHRGFDIASYFKSGIGRHGDSLGNRETFSTPGMQWMSVGSGVEHAEGGATEKGTKIQGFQIWINVPSHHKMDDPDYGTVPTKDLPLHSLGSGVAARILAGTFGGYRGPFQTKQPVQMVDFEIKSGPAEGSETVEHDFDIDENFDTAMLYVYEGGILVNSQSVDEGSIVVFNVTDNGARGIHLQSDDKTNNSVGAKAILFAGRKLKEPVAWHGPIVMNTQQELMETFRDLRAGRFPPVRVDWDYKKIASKPSMGTRKNGEDSGVAGEL